MKFIKFLTVIICLLVYVNTLTALEVGEKAPPLDISKWINGPPVSINKTDKKVYVVFFWATWSNISPNLMNYVSRENFIFADDGVVFVGISKESPKRIKDFLKKHPDVNFSIGRDNQAETYSAYMQGTKGVPMFFIIGRDKKLIWKGSPFEANRVLVRALNGTFDSEIQKKIVKYRRRIQKAAQMLDNKEKLYYAKKILKLDPTDRIAMNIVIDNYILERKDEKAIDFIRWSQKKAHGNKYIQRELFFLELSIVRAMNNTLGKEKLVELVKNYSNVFNNDSSALNSLVIVVSKDVPLSIIPLSKILNISERAVKLAEANHQDKENLSSCLQSLARVYYYIGQLNKAVSTQKKAIQLMGNKTIKADKEVALLMDIYYEEALKLYSGGMTSSNKR
jgi:peroxiredoxin